MVRASRKLERRRYLARLMENRSLDSLLVSSRENVRYFSGFDGTFGDIFLDRKGAFLLTDSRYVSQAGTEAPAYAVREIAGGYAGIARFARSRGAKKLGFEGEELPFTAYAMLRELGGVKKTASVSNELACAREVKDAAETANMARAQEIATAALSGALSGGWVGRTEMEIALRMEEKMRREGSEALPFEIIVASGERGALPHGRASAKRIRRKEFVVVDFGARYNGYCSDQTRTFYTGRPGRAERSLYDIVRKAKDLATAMVRPGAKCSELDSAARNYIASKGYGRYFRHGLGHGVGLAVHEGPQVSSASRSVLMPGMVFTIEPGVYIPGWGGIRIEDMVRVTGDGGEIIPGRGDGGLVCID